MSSRRYPLKNRLELQFAFELENRILICSNLEEIQAEFIKLTVVSDSLKVAPDDHRGDPDLVCDHGLLHDDADTDKDFVLPLEGCHHGRMTRFPR